MTNILKQPENIIENFLIFLVHFINHNTIYFVYSVSVNLTYFQQNFINEMAIF